MFGREGRGTQEQVVCTQRATSPAANGAVSMVSFQFGAFHFGARQFDACQFGVFHFDAVPVRRVSVWRDASLARFTSARFPFLCLF